MFGPAEIAIVLLIVLIVFGAGKLPSVMKDIGKGVKSFKDAVNDDEDASFNDVEEKDTAKPAKAEPVKTVAAPVKKKKVASTKKKVVKKKSATAKKKASTAKKKTSTAKKSTAKKSTAKKK